LLLLRWGNFWLGNLYVGLHLNWDYTNHTINMCMPNYVAKALLRFNHPMPSSPQHSPHFCATPSTALKSNSLHPWTSPPLSLQPKPRTSSKSLARSFRTHKLLTALCLYPWAALRQPKLKPERQRYRICTNSSTMPAPTPMPMSNSWPAPCFSPSTATRHIYPSHKHVPAQVEISTSAASMTQPIRHPPTAPYKSPVSSSSMSCHPQLKLNLVPCSTSRKMPAVSGSHLKNLDICNLPLPSKPTTNALKA
jgi:hypothetical protein